MEYEVQRKICQFQQNGTFCDVTLQGMLEHYDEKRQQIQAHRVILASCCDYFKAMFTLDMIESHNSEVTIQNIKHHVLEKIVEYCYSGVIIINYENVQDVLMAANFFKINRIEVQCVRFLDMCVNYKNVFDIGELAKRFSYKSLIRKTNIYALKHYHACSKTRAFLMLSIEEISKLISDNDLNIIQEKDFYNSIIRWVKHDIRNRSPYLNRLLGNVMFNHLDRSFLLNNIAKEPLVINSADNRQFLYKSLDYHLSATTKMQRPTSPLIRRKYPKRIFMVGGKNENGIQNATNIFHLSDMQWETGPCLAIPRSHAAVVLADDFLYCFGGIGENGSDLKSVEKYDCLRNTWTNEAPLKHCKGALQAIYLDKVIYVMGGSDGNEALDFIEAFDTDSIKQQWKMLPPMPFKRRNYTLVTFLNNLCIIGGHNGKNITSKCTLFDPTNGGKWTDIGSLNKPRMDHAAAVTDAEKLFVYGGRKEDGYLDCMEKYNNELNMWLIVKHTFRPTIGTALLYIKHSHHDKLDKDSLESESLFIIGGYDANARFLEDMNIVDLSSVDYDMNKGEKMVCKIAFTGSYLV